MSSLICLLLKIAGGNRQFSIFKTAIVLRLAVYPPARLLVGLHGIIDGSRDDHCADTCLNSGSISSTFDKLFNDIDIIRVGSRTLSASCCMSPRLIPMCQSFSAKIIVSKNVSLLEIQL